MISGSLRPLSSATVRPDSGTSATSGDGSCIGPSAAVIASSGSAANGSLCASSACARSCNNASYTDTTRVTSQPLVATQRVTASRNCAVAPATPALPCAGSSPASCCTAVRYASAAASTHTYNAALASSTTDSCPPCCLVGGGVAE